MSKESNIKPITRLALGRAHEIGEIFDAVEEKFTGIQVFSENSEKFINEIDCGGNEYYFVTDETVENKLEKMNLEAELKMSFMAGLVKVEGSGKYLNESNASSERISYSVIFKIRTKRQILKIFNRKLRHDDNFPSDLIDPSLGTHIINGVTWGAQIIATFSMDINKVKSDFQLEGNLRAFVKCAVLEISGNAKFSKAENSDLYKKNISVSIIGDIMPIGNDTLITDLEGFKSFLRNVPSMLEKTNKGLGVPLEYNLFPLHMLFDKNKILANKILNDMSEEFLRKSLKVIDLIKAVQNQISFLIDDCFRYEAIFHKEINDLVEIKDNFETETLDFKTKLKQQVILFRSAENSKTFTGLENLFLAYSKSDWYPDKVKQKIFQTRNYCDRKIKFFDRFQNKNCKILDPFESYDEAYTDDNKIRIYILYTSMKFFLTANEDTNKIHGMFFDLCKTQKLKEESFFYIYDYDSIPEVYKQHGSPSRPKIIYEYKRQRITEDFYSQKMHLEKVKNYLAWKDQEERFKIVENYEEFTKEKNEYFLNKEIPTVDSAPPKIEKNKFMAVLVTGHNIAQVEEKDDYDLDCFKDVISLFNIQKVVLIEHEKFNKVDLFKKLKKMSIFLYHDGNLITTDYSADRAFIHNIIELSQLGCQYINISNYARFKHEDKFIFLYSQDLYKNNTEIFNRNYHKFKRLNVQKLENKENNNNNNNNNNNRTEAESIEEKLRAIEQQSNYYLLDCGNSSHYKIISDFFDIKESLTKSTIIISYNNKIITTDYFNDTSFHDLLLSQMTNINKFGVSNSLPKIFQLKGSSHYVPSLLKMNDKQIISTDFFAIKIWDIDSQQCIKVITQDKEIIDEKEIMKEIIFFRKVQVIKLNETSIIAAGWKYIKIFDIESGICLIRLEEHTRSVNDLCLIKDNCFVSCGDDDLIIIWDLNVDSKRSLRILTGHRDSVKTITKMTEKELISGGYDGTIKFWNTATGECLHTIDDQGYINILLKLNEKLFASSTNENSIKIWDYHSKNCIKTLFGHANNIESLVRIDDKTFASGDSYDGIIKIWDIDSGLPINTLSGKTRVFSLEMLNEYDLIVEGEKLIFIWRNFRKFKEIIEVD